MQPSHFSTSPSHFTPSHEEMKEEEEEEEVSEKGEYWSTSLVKRRYVVVPYVRLFRECPSKTDSISP